MKTRLRHIFLRIVQRNNLHYDSVVVVGVVVVVDDDDDESHRAIKRTIAKSAMK